MYCAGPIKIYALGGNGSEERPITLNFQGIVRRVENPQRVASATNLDHARASPLEVPMYLRGWDRKVGDAALTTYDQAAIDVNYYGPIELDCRLRAQIELLKVISTGLSRGAKNNRP